MLKPKQSMWVILSMALVSHKKYIYILYIYHESRFVKKQYFATFPWNSKKDRNLAIREKVSGLICLFCLGVSATNQSFCTDLYGISSA
jgi:hypothetical protein